MPDHLSDLKAVDGLDFLTESKKIVLSSLNPSLNFFLYKPINFKQYIQGQSPFWVCLSHDKLCIGFKYTRLSSEGFKASLSCF